MRPADIRVGTSGWRFADWAGTFYPFRVPQSKWLEYYAARFRVGELNSTYYRIPPLKSIQAIDAKTPDGFEILAKVHGDVSHIRKDEAESMRRLLDVLAPLRDSQKLTGLLVQFPNSFRRTAGNEEYLARLHGLSDGVQMFVEFRHGSWDANDVATRFRELGLSWVSVDEPALEGLMTSRLQVTSDAVYVRMHGRNAAAWYNKAAGDRYDYSYSEEELTEWGERLLSADAPARRAYVLFNNCYHGQAPRNALWLKGWLEQKKPPEPGYDD